MPDSPAYVIYQEPPRRPLTARNLSDFALCPQKFLLSFFVSRQAAERFLGGAAALHEGVRAALIQCYREGGPAASPAERLLGLFEQNWEGRLCADSLEEEQLHRQGLEMLRRYHAAHEAETARTVALDLRMEADLGEHRFVAVVDRALQEAGEPLTLLRYKTTRQVPGPGGLAKDPSLALLLIVGETHFGSSGALTGGCRGEYTAKAAPTRAAQAAIYAVRTEKRVVAAIGEAERRAWRELFVQQATAVRRAREYPTVVGRHCSVCRCRSICPAWHPPPPREETGE